MNITVIGCGYLGAVHACAMAELGHRVVGVDVDRDKVEALRATLHGSYLSALVTDESTARSLLEGI